MLLIESLDQQTCLEMDRHRHSRGFLLTNLDNISRNERIARELNVCDSKINDLFLQIELFNL